MVAFQVPVAIVPTLVKLELITDDPSVVLDSTETLFISYTLPVAIFISPATLTCPEELPIFVVVAAPPMFRVVAFVLNRFAERAEVINDPPFIFTLLINEGFVKNESRPNARLLMSEATSTGSSGKGYERL